MATKGTSLEPVIPEDSLHPEPSPAPSPAMGDHCSSNPPLDPSEVASGEIVKLGETEVYISKPADAGTQETSLLLLLTNGVGVHSPNNQVQADHFAKAGYFVVMPDLFNGDPAPSGANTVAVTEENLGLLDQIKLRAIEGVKGFMIDIWLARHTPENTMPIIERVLKAVKDEYGDKQYTTSAGAFAVGYCFGGKYALRLAATNEIVAAAVAHGTLVSVEDITNVKQPVTFACVENDSLFPDEIREEGLNVLRQNGREVEMKVYKGVPHGFAVYGSYPDRYIKTSQNEVFEQFVQFLRTY